MLSYSLSCRNITKVLNSGIKLISEKGNLCLMSWITIEVKILRIIQK